ncbi:MAG TPA: Smr/MutS family protein, partial [Spirochaetales bacterium]|nr:Smr/MutS family protein [Spirochaetales bacterium]
EALEALRAARLKAQSAPRPAAAQADAGAAAPGPAAGAAAPAATGASSSGAAQAVAGPAEAPGAEAQREARWSEAEGLLLDGLLYGAPDLAPLSRIVFKVVNKDGSLRDLPELRQARDRIARAHRDIASITDSYFKNPEVRAMLQSDAPTQRDGRTVLAIRANFRGRVKGIVHEVSATGQTVFVEPEDLVQKNNELVEEEARYRQELQRILRETTERLLPEAPALAAARRAMGGFDGIYARARHARLGGLVLARDLAEGFTIRKARHPLIGRRAVPIDVELPAGTRTLIVTGPNTGGKTVTLKTVGLLALMNQFGLALPAAPESGFAVFDAVYADIGDEQSIDQSLSTFSGHMRVIGGIANDAGPRSLVLLDELGSGTDPEEGCAVAMGLLDWFIGRGCLTVLTTHHGILKNYGYTRPGCLNASMDFDAASLQPTYRVLMGVPGESRALEVASQHGLRSEIIEGARKYLAEERADVSELIKGLTEKHRKLEDLESERRSRLKEAREEQRKADLSRLKLRQRELELREQGVSDIRRLLGESRKTLENLVKEIREGEGSLGSDKTRAVKDFLAGFAEAVEGEERRLESAREEAAEEARGAELADRAARAASEAAGGPEPGKRKAGAPGGARAPAPLVLEEGAAVLVNPGKKRGVVLRRAKKGYWLVETESIRLTVPESKLELVPEAAAAKMQVAVELAPRGEGGRTTAAFELDLRGFRLAEALEAVEKQIDAASLQGLSLFSIIHGTGEGILGKGIHDYLRRQPAVAEYHFARPEEGGYGKTVVRLK